MLRGIAAQLLRGAAQQVQRQQPMHHPGLRHRTVELPISLVFSLIMVQSSCTAPVDEVVVGPLAGRRVNTRSAVSVPPYVTLRPCNCIVQELVAKGVTDPARVSVGGHSYGAFMAANLVAHCPKLFAAAIARSGEHWAEVWGVAPHTERAWALRGHRHAAC
jgi:hypothetical protein